MGRDHQRAFWSTSQCADDPTLCHAVHLPLTVGHPLRVICVVSCVRGQFPVYPSQPTYRRAQVPSVRGIMRPRRTGGSWRRKADGRSYDVPCASHAILASQNAGRPTELATILGGCSGSPNAGRGGLPIRSIKGLATGLVGASDGLGGRWGCARLALPGARALGPLQPPGVDRRVSGCPPIGLLQNNLLRRGPFSEEPRVRLGSPRGEGSMPVPLPPPVRCLSGWASHFVAKAATPKPIGRRRAALHASYGSAGHPAIIPGRQPQGRRGSRSQLKYRKQPHAK